MATSVEMDEETKSMLEALQARIERQTGRRVTTEEILDRLVADAHESRTGFVDSFRTSDVPMDDAAVDEFLSWTFDSGTETTEADIDRILYDDRT